MAKESFYFSHDSNAITDTKILNMRADYGLEGYGLYWAIIEMMRNEENYILVLDKNTYRAIKTLTNTDIDIEKFINDCIEDYKLFIKENNYFYSKSLLSRMKEYEKKREINRENGKLGGRPKQNKNPIKTETKPIGYQNETENNQKKIKENKVKENKINNNIVVVNDSCVDGLQSDSCVDGFAEVMDFYNNNINLITPYSSELLTDFTEELGSDLVIYAMQKAVSSNQRNLNYIKGILNSWSKKGIKTLIQAKNEEQEFQTKKDTEKKPSNCSNYKQREYSDMNKFYSNKGDT